MGILDYIIVILLIICALVGFKKGLISSLVSFLGIIVVILIAFFLKNPISSILYNNLPFFNFMGSFKGMTVLNILIYEAISYFATISVLIIILKVAVALSGVLDKFVNATVVLTLPNKLAGAFVGLIEGFILSFALIFTLSLISPFSSLYKKSNYADIVLSKTPLLGSIAKDTYNSVNEIYEITLKNSNKEDRNQANLEGLDVLLKYEIITPDSASNLISNGKLKIEGANEVIDKYRKDVNND